MLEKQIFSIPCYCHGIITKLVETEHADPCFLTGKAYREMWNGSNCIHTDRYFPVGITSLLPGLDLRLSFVQQHSRLTCRRERQGSDTVSTLEIIPSPSIPSCSACTGGWVEGFCNACVWSSPKRRVTALNMQSLGRMELLKHHSCLELAPAAPALRAVQVPELQHLQELCWF